MSSGDSSSNLMQVGLVGVGALAVGYLVARALHPQERPVPVFEPLGQDDLDLSTLKQRNGSGRDAGSSLAIEKLAEQFEDFKMVLVVRNDLKMGKGKIAAQCSHAALGLYQQLQGRAPKALRRWEYDCAHVKVVVKCETEEEMLLLREKARAAGLATYIVTDAGRTQIAPNSKTVMAMLGPTHIQNEITGHLKLM